jgi:sodium/hydrogen exchanger 8
MGGEEHISIFLVFFAALLAVVLVLSKHLQDRPVLASFLPEGAMVLAVGMVAGFIIHLFLGERYALAQGADDDDNNEQNVDDDLGALLSFSPEIFFIALLPPIIFNSGLRLGALFFRHITPIVLFAVLGTTISALSVAFMLHFILSFGLCGDFSPSLTELLTFGALISSTDPVSTLAVFQAKKVDPQLFYLVFGESVLNDALAIVLFDAFARFVAKENNASTIALGIGEFFVDFLINCVGSLCLGCFGGLFTAFLFKQIDLRQNRLVEISLYLLMMYIPFLLAEIMHLSGIVTILFTGVAANRYVVPNLSSVTKVNADMLFRLLAHLAETSIFLELGLSVFGLIGHWNWSFIGWSLLACFIARALNVYPITFVFNRCLLKERQPSEDYEDYENHEFQNDNSQHSRHPELSEGLDPNFRRYIDEGMVLDQRTKSFSEQSAASEITATPLRKKDLKIRSKTANMMWFTGLRGAVAYACVRTFPDTLGHQKDFTMTTMAIVLITVFLLGGTTEMTLNFLQINIGVDEETYMKKSLREPVVSSAITNFGEWKAYKKNSLCSRINV